MRLDVERKDGFMTKMETLNAICTLEVELCCKRMYALEIIIENTLHQMAAKQKFIQQLTTIKCEMLMLKNKPHLLI